MPSREFDVEAAWLRTRWDRGAYEAPPVIRRVAPNTMWAVNATTTTGEILGSGTAEPNQTFQLSGVPVLEGERIEVREPELPPQDELDALGKDALAVVSDAAGRPLEIWLRWQPVLDFFGSGPRSRHYVLDRITGELRFGDGRHGMAPPQGRANVRAASYRKGGGVTGNRPAGKITQLKSAVPYVAGVTNLEAADGGAAEETLDEVRGRGARTLRHRDRAVTLADFEDLAVEASTEVARMKALPVTTPAQAGRVRLVVVPEGGAQPVPSLQLLGRVEEYLRAGGCSRRSTSGSAVPGWVSVSVTAEVAPVALERATAVETAVLQRLADFLHPLRGGLDGTGWPFGRRPYRSDLLAVVAGIDGVDHVRTLDVAETTTTEPPSPDAFLVYSGEHQISLVAADSWPPPA